MKRKTTRNTASSGKAAKKAPVAPAVAERKSTLRVCLVGLRDAVPLALSGLLVSLAVSWVLLALVNFSYGFWHDHAGIGAAIDEYGESNLYRKGFHLTTREQRIDLFAGINRAIHSGGKGLTELTYIVPGHAPQTLLREPEVVHLQDVANLIDCSTYAAVIALSIWFGLLVYYIHSGRPVPSIKLQLAGTLLFMAVVAVVVFVVGPVKVFYALHVLLFPDGHQWFFYYQDSLMSTMMKAPNLFGWIAVEWVLLAVACFVALQLAAAHSVRRLQKK
jgi:hypothetical protein